MKNKIKTRKSARKRFRITKNGKVLHRSQGARHLKGQKTKKQLRSLKQIKQITGVHAKKIKRMMVR